MLFNLVLATLPVGVILLGSEYLWRKKIILGEKARKFIHILAGVWMAFWPLYLPFDGIIVVATAALTLLIYSRTTHLFHAIYAVKRKTYGDIFYGLAILSCAFLAQSDWIFTVSILLLALADGVAAVVGRYVGSTNTYFVFGSKHLKKSIAGTVGFFLFAQISVLVGWFIGGAEVIKANPLLVFFILPVLSTAFENMMPFGLDNLTTPLLATLLLNSMV